MQHECTTEEDAFLRQVFLRDFTLQKNLETAKESDAWLMALPQYLSRTELSMMDFKTHSASDM